MGAPQVVFLSYASEDLGQVEEVYRRLQSADYQPWMDTHNLLGGEKWEPAIFRALRQADFVLVLLTERTTNKRGFLRREIQEALLIAAEKLPTDIYVIPVRLEPCTVIPELDKYQWVDLFVPDGWDKLLQSLEEGAKRRKGKETSEVL